MDQNEFKKLFLPLSNIMYNISMNILADPEDALDAIQETYYKLWTIKDNLNKIKNIKAYTITILKRKCIDKIRYDQQKNISINKFNNTNNVMNAEDKIIAFEGKQKIIKWIKQQKEPNKTIFILRHFSEKTYKEISNITNFSEGNIRVIISRMRNDLKKYLQK